MRERRSSDDENNFKTVSSEKVVILNKKVVVINMLYKTLKTFLNNPLFFNNIKENVQIVAFIKYLF